MAWVGRVALLAVVVGSVSVGAGLVAADGSPLADAGLDQSATLGTTVQLDASGSSAPNGTIQSYEWELTAPDGSTVVPDCPTCAMTSFIPYQQGQYEVTVTVTDGEGRTDADTLYVTVDDEGVEEPSVSLSGDDQPTTGSEVEYEADVDADLPLTEATWSVDGTEESTEQLNGTGDTTTFTHEFADADEAEVTVTVVDRAGQEGSSTMAVDPQSPATGGGGGNTPDGFYDPQYGGDGGWVETSDDGTPRAPTSVRDAYNYISDNGIESNVAANPIGPTTSDVVMGNMDTYGD